MDTKLTSSERLQTLGEEIANSISHGLGLALALLGTPFLLMATAKRGDGISIAAAAVFSVSMILLYGASMIYHALAHNRAKRLFKVLDSNCSATLGRSVGVGRRWPRLHGWGCLLCR